MSLPSQTARAGSQTGRTNMYRAKRSDPKPIIAAAGAVVVFGLGVWGLAKYLAPRHADAADINPAAAAPPAGSPVANLTKPSSPAESRPARLLATETPAAADPKPPEPKPADTTPPPPMEFRQGRTGAMTTGAAAKPEQPALGHTPGVPVDPPANPRPTPPPAAAVVTQPAPTSAGAQITTTGAVATTVAAANQKLAAGDPVAARLLYSEALRDPSLPEPDRAQVRSALTKINDDLVFSSKVTPGDPFVDTYTVQSGDSVIKIAQRLQLAPDYRLIMRVNNIHSGRDLQVGKKLKIVKGPFNAVVTKSAFRLDLYMGDGENPDTWVYVRSFPVGLGAESKNHPTPVGTFRSKKGSKLVNPPWINPDTGQHFAGGAPDNPIGKFWVGLEGLGDAAKYTGYGIHGTIEPDSIGQQRSAGCVRMAADDIALVFETMGEQISIVKIVP